MPTATCPSTDELRALSLGETHAEASESLLEHVAGCTDCQAELEAVDERSDAWITSLRGEDLGEPFEQEGACQTALAKAIAAYSIVSSEQPVMPELPKQIGEYEILRPLGHGGMGSVWLARHTKLGREVALKLLSRQRWTHPQLRERFEAEMRAIGRLSHPNIVIAHDARDVGGCAVLVTEYVDGFDLGKLLQRTGPLPVAEACEIARQVAVALEYTHLQGFVHRDIKPSNVMLSRSGSIKLLDLGLARLQLDEGAAEMTATGQSLGTADYMAPEQVSDARSVDIRADIYSLGCTLMKLLTGRAPFAEHTTSFAKMTAHVSGQPPRLNSLRADIPQQLSDLVAQMLAKRPQDRPQSPADIRQALTAFCAGSDLGQLVQRAEASTSLSEVPQPALATAVAMSGSSVRSRGRSGWFHRRVPTYIAIAAGFFGFLLGGLLSIIIIITNPDGTKSVLKLAEGSKVEIQAEGPALQVKSDEMVPRSPVEGIAVKETQSNDLPWETYNEQALTQYRAAGRPVLLFVFAEWALIGESLRREAIERPMIMKSLEQGNFVLMKADWTGGTYELSTKLQELLPGERISIPLVALYPAGADTEPIVLQDNFNQVRLFKAIQQALAASGANQSSVSDRDGKARGDRSQEETPVQRLAFGVIETPGPKESAAYVRWLTAAESIDAPLTRKPVRTQLGTWYPAGLESIGIKDPYVLVQNDGFIDWKDVQGHIVTSTVSQKGMTAELDEALVKQFEELTANNVGKRLAIIVNDQVRGLPKIVAPLKGSNIEIPDSTFKKGELQNLMQWLHGSLVFPFTPDSARSEKGQGSTDGSAVTETEATNSDAVLALKNARQLIADALQVGFRDASPEVIQSVVEAFFDPTHIRRCTLDDEHFSFTLRMSAAIEAAGLRGGEVQARVGEEGAARQADDTRRVDDAKSHQIHAPYENAIDIATLARGLGDALAIEPLRTAEEPETAEHTKTMPMLFGFSAKDPVRMQALLTQVAEGSGWTPWREDGHQYFPIYSRSGDPKAADAIVCAMRFSVNGPQTDEIAIGAYKRLRLRLSE
jgi:serine/threonine protein kinase